MREGTFARLDSLAAQVGRLGRSSAGREHRLELHAAQFALAERVQHVARAPPTAPQILAVQVGADDVHQRVVAAREHKQTSLVD